MGGHQSKQSVAAAAAASANIVQRTAQDCINTGSRANVMNVGGYGNRVQNTSQRVQLSVDANCPAFTEQSSEYRANLQAAVSQVLNDQQLALTQWMDGSRDDQASSISQTVTANFSQDMTKKCVSALNGYNVLNVGGAENTVSGAVQDVGLSVIAGCLMREGQTSQAVASIAATANQHSVYTSENPLAFITDAMQSVAKDAITLIALLFVFVACVAVTIRLVRHRRGPPAGARIESAAGRPTAGPPIVAAAQ